VLLTAACGPRQVEVRTAPSAASAAQVQVNNTLTDAVNVYVVQNGSDTFLRQVGANSTATIPVQGFSAGTTVSFKAVTVDGAKTYTKSNVPLTGTVMFRLP
jgi:hypothetical protein